MKKQRTEKLALKLILMIIIWIFSFSGGAVWAGSNGEAYDFSNVSSQNGISITGKESSYSITLDIHILRICVSKVKGEDGNTYDKVSIPESALFTKDEGAPQLPYISEVIRIPNQAANLSVKATINTSPVRYNDIVAYPSPKVVVKTTEEGYEYLGEEFYFDAENYSGKDFIPGQIAEIIEDGYFRSVRMIRLNIYPARYNPASKLLEFNKDITVNVSWDVDIDTPTKRDATAGFKDLISDMVLNYTADEAENVIAKKDPFAAEPHCLQQGSVTYITGSELLNIAIDCDYLIITHENFFQSTAMADVANYRANYNNLDIVIAKVDDIYAQFPNAEGNDYSIRDFIRYAYDNWNTPPQYLLLIGDTEYIPSHQEQTQHCTPPYMMDYEEWYTRVSGGDEWPDLAMGRWPVDSEADISGIKDKVIAYEQKPIYPDDYHERALYLEGEFISRQQRIIDILANTWFNVTELYCSGLPIYQDVINAIDFGQNIVYTACHGDQYGWMGIFGTSQIPLLSNANYPIILAHSCSTADLTFNDSFGEMLVKTNNKGAAAYYGATGLAGDMADYETLTTILNDFNFDLGKAIMLGEFLNPDDITGEQQKIYILLGDPALQSFGYKLNTELPDLAIPYFGFEYNEYPKQAIVCIKNIGEADAYNVLLRVTILDLSTGINYEIGEATIPELCVDASTEVTINITMPLLNRDYVITAFVDPEDQIDESFELNNSVKRAIDSTDTTPPDINIISPQDGSAYTASSVMVEGEVTDDNFEITSVVINEEIVDVIDGAFNHEISGLEAGKHTITVTAEDGVGNSASKSVTVYIDFSPPNMNSINTPRIVKEGSLLEFALSATDDSETTVEFLLDASVLPAELQENISTAAIYTSFNAITGETTGTFEWAPRTGDSSYYFPLTITARDIAGRCVSQEIAIVVISEGKALSVDDYDDENESTNSLGFWTGWGASGNSVAGEIDLAPLDGDKVKKFTYNCALGGEYLWYASNLWDDIHYSDISDFEYLSFRVKGAEGGEDFYIQLQCGSTLPPQWVLVSSSYSGITNIAQLGTVAFCDIDADGDYDIFIPTLSRINFYRNDGTAQEPLFIKVSDTYQGITDLVNDCGLAFCDIDADGDYDMFIGRVSGKVRFYRNDGTAQEPNLTFISGAYQGVSGGYGSTLTFCDIDADGDYDMFIGGGNGVIAFYRNDGTPQEPGFTLVTSTFGGMYFQYATTPTFCDIDRDGDYDMFIGKNDGTITFYRNDGTPQNCSFTLVSNAYEGIDVGAYSAPEFCDIDSDGDNDMFIKAGSGTGCIWFYQNETIPGTTLIELHSSDYFTVGTEWQDIKIPLTAFPGLKKYMMRAISIVFRHDGLSKLQGAVYINNLKLSKGHEKPESTGAVKINKNTKSLYVNDEPCYIKGVCYQPVPIGTFPPQPYDSAIYDRDFPLLVDMGCNAIKTWSAPGPNLMNKAQQYGLKVIANFRMDYDVDFSNLNVRNNIKLNFTTFVNNLKNSPALLMWSIGHENNYHNGSNSAYYSLCNELAEIAYQLEGNSYHPVIIVNGHIFEAGDTGKGADDIQLNYIDAWGCNIYAEHLDAIDWFGEVHNLFDVYKDRSSKPIIITEYGTDAFHTTDINTLEGYEDEDMQADWVAHNTFEIMDARDVCLGACVMEYSDEWWKDGDGSPSEHDAGGIYTGDWGNVAPDDFMNEEYFGIVSVSDNGEDPDVVTPRQIYHSLRNIFRDDQRPLIANIRPQDGTSSTNSRPPFHADISDNMGLKEARLWLDPPLEPSNPTWAVCFIGQTSTIIDVTPQVNLSYGIHTYRLVISDIVGNIATATTTFTVSPSGCFLKGTPILLPDSTTRPIEELKTGDTILAFDEGTRQFKPDTVKHVFVIPDETEYLIINNKIKVTPSHCFATLGGSASVDWKEAGTLKIGDKLLNANGEAEPIASIDLVKDTVTVYNLEVNGSTGSPSRAKSRDPYHTFIAGNVVVHNAELKGTVSINNKTYQILDKGRRLPDLVMMNGQYLSDPITLSLPST